MKKKRIKKYENALKHAKKCADKEKNQREAIGT